LKLHDVHDFPKHPTAIPMEKIILNSITFVLLFQKLQNEKCAHCFTKGFLIVIIV
jgi:hypothetical protein